MKLTAISRVRASRFAQSSTVEKGAVTLKCLARGMAGFVTMVGGSGHLLLVDSGALGAAIPPRPLVCGCDLLKVVAAFRRTETACVALPRQYLIALPAD